MDLLLALLPKSTTLENSAVDKPAAVTMCFRAEKSDTSCRRSQKLAFWMAKLIGCQRPSEQVVEKSSSTWEQR